MPPTPIKEFQNLPKIVTKLGDAHLVLQIGLGLLEPDTEDDGGVDCVFLQGIVGLIHGLYLFVFFSFSSNALNTPRFELVALKGMSYRLIVRAKLTWKRRIRSVPTKSQSNPK
ncbi:hypothetical protein ACFX2F_013106 [Malus domestica]